MIEHLNAEIVLNNITDISEGIEWLKSTFLYIRMKKNPNYYQLEKILTQNKLELKLKGILYYHLEICLTQINELERASLITMDIEGFSFSSNELGKSMARYYSKIKFNQVAFETMKILNEINKDSNMEDILILLSKSKEFNEINIRSGDKKCLNTINKDKNIRFPLKNKLKDNNEKIFLLIQYKIFKKRSFLGDITVDDWSLKQQSILIFQNLPRILRLYIEYVSQKNYYLPLRDCLTL
jgi:ATP-dependent DNA helicase HFM1/MER3